MLTSTLAFGAIVAHTILAQAAVAPADGFSQQVIEQAHRKYAPAICLITYTSEITNPTTGEQNRRDSSSPGLLVSSSGLIMAPGHMQLENSEPFNISVTVGQGEAERKFGANLLKKPDDVNVCFLELQSETPLTGLPYVQFVRGAKLGLGEPVLTLGIMSETLDFARGIYTCRVGAIMEKPRTTYALDSSVRFGFVGCPVVDTLGRAVGVLGFDLTPAEGGDLYVRSGHPLIYQADLFQKYIESPPGATEVKVEGEEAFLGVFSQPLTDDFAEYWGLPKDGGIVVSSVMPGTPAETAGLKPGDVIIDFAGTPIRAKLDREVIGFTKLVRETGVGTTANVKLLREGKPMELQIALTARPKSARDAGEFKDEVFGLTVREITTDVRILLNMSEDVKGVIVRRIKSGSVAEIAGMRPGLVIMNLGDHPIASIDDFKGAVEEISAKKPKEVSAFCRLGNVTGFFRLQPRWEADAQR